MEAFAVFEDIGLLRFTVSGGLKLRLKLLLAPRFIYQSGLHSLDGLFGKVRAGAFGGRGYLCIDALVDLPLDEEYASTDHSATEYQHDQECLDVHISPAIRSSRPEVIICQRPEDACHNSQYADRETGHRQRNSGVRNR